MATLPKSSFCRHRFVHFAGQILVIRDTAKDIKMLSFVARSANASSVTVAATQTVANGTKALCPAVSIQIERTLVPPAPQKLTTNSLTASLPKNPIRAAASLGGNLYF